MRRAVISPSAVLILITLCSPAEINNSFASIVPWMGKRSKSATRSQLRSQTLSKLQARIHIVSQRISALQAQITAIETTHNARVDQLQEILTYPQSGQKAPTKRGSALPKHMVGFTQTPLAATLSVNGTSITLTPAGLSIKGVRQIVLQANSIHLKSPLLQFNEGNRPLAGSGDLVAGVLAYTSMGIPIPGMYLHGLIVSGSTSVLVP